MEFLMVASSSYLIELMAVIFIVALGLRFVAYKANKADQLYYSTFTREIERRVERDDIAKVNHDDVEEYIEGLLDEVGSSLPTRGVRLKKVNEDEESERKVVSVREYASGNQSLIHSLKSETNAFKAKQKPNFDQLTHRVMDKDSHWIKLHNLLPVDSVIRMIDVLPGIFIVIGIFGTFIGITNALPRIAEIDFNNVSNSSSVLSIFVKDVSFAMQTSIAGIAFSLIISLLNTLFPINTIRESIAREVENCLEYLWYFVHGGSGEQQQHEAYTKMIMLLENIDEKIDDPTTDAIQSGRGETFSKMVNLLEHIDKRIDTPSSTNKVTKPRSKVSKARSKVTKASSKTTKVSKTAPKLKKAS